MYEYYYPENLAAKTLIAAFWTFKDILILTAIFIFNILLFIAFHIYIFFIAFVIYGFSSMKIANGYSLTKFAILYIRFLFTDQLLFHWRERK